MTSERYVIFVVDGKIGYRQRIYLFSAAWCLWYANAIVNTLCVRETKAWISIYGWRSKMYRGKKSRWNTSRLDWYDVAHEMKVKSFKNKMAMNIRIPTTADGLFLFFFFFVYFVVIISRIKSRCVISKLIFRNICMFMCNVTSVPAISGTATVFHRYFGNVSFFCISEIDLFKGGHKYSF